MELAINCRLPWGIQSMEIDDRKTNRYQSIKLVNWFRLVSVNQWTIDNHTKKPFIDCYWLAQQCQTDVTHIMHATACPIIIHVWEALGMKLVKQFWTRLFNAKNIPRCTCTRSTHLPVIAFPVSQFTREVRKEALLNIRCIVKGYNLCCFEVNVGELFTAKRRMRKRV